MNLTPSQRNRLIDYLTGSMAPMSEALRELNIIISESEATAAISDTIFLCAGCPRWTDVERGTMSLDGQICDDCAGSRSDRENDDEWERE